jgi:hypothetical protein
MRAAAILVLVAACAPPPPAVVDAGVQETCSENLPPPSDACIVDPCGNEIGVGQTCTKDGAECSDWDFFGGEAGLCTADVDDTDLWFCTRPCDEDADCGSDAVCQGDPDVVDSPRGCVPVACSSR